MTCMRQYSKQEINPKGHFRPLSEQTFYLFISPRAEMDPKEATPTL